MDAKAINTRLEEKLKGLEQRLHMLLRSDVEFVELIHEDLMSAGGKRIRPRLALLSSELLGGVPHEVELALAVELLHSATLLHDDLVDDAEIRRGRQAAFRRYGNAVSVLSGDYLLSRVLYLLAETGRMSLVVLLAEAARRLAEGEVFQFQVYAYADHSRDNYERIIEGKTAALMRACTEGAALLGDAAVNERQALATFGHAYGMAFQMRDDYLDMMGDSKSLGKPLGGDVREGKITLITLELLAAHPEEVALIIRRGGKGPGDIERLRALALHDGVARAVVGEISGWVSRAQDALSVFPATAAKGALLDLAEQEMVRLR